MKRSVATVLAVFALVGASCASRPQLWKAPGTARQEVLEARILELERASVRQRLELERLERRLAALEASQVAHTPSFPPAEPIAPSSPSTSSVLRSPIEESDLDEEEAAASRDPEASYRSALEALRAGRYAECEEQLRRFLTHHPDSDLADNAWFWIAESLFLRGRFQEAVEAYRQGIDRYPTGNKTPDALYKLGTALASIGEARRALEVWQELVRRFPKSDAAGRAREHLPGNGGR